MTPIEGHRCDECGYLEVTDAPGQRYYSHTAPNPAPFGWSVYPSLGMDQHLADVKWFCSRRCARKFLRNPDVDRLEP